MYKHILIATDGSELAGKAVTTGLALAKQLKAKVTAVTATEPWTAMVTARPRSPSRSRSTRRPRRRMPRASSARSAPPRSKQDVACETVRVNDFPAEGIIETAKARGCDLIVMASHGRRGLARVLLGSQATRVLTLSTVPVLICR